jgi:ribosomal protein L31E
MVLLVYYALGILLLGAGVVKTVALKTRIKLTTVLVDDIVGKKVYRRGIKSYVQDLRSSCQKG